MDTDRIVADLHAHTTVSDGTMTVAELAATAADAGLDCVAVTDHDRVHPDLDAPVVEREGLLVVRGIELRVDAGFERLDLLGYAVDRTAALSVRLQPIGLGVEPRPGLGRPHIARAIEESAAPYDYAGAFDELIGNDGPCYVAREVTGLERGVELLRDACAFVGLAHPFRYDDVDAALDVARELDAVERFYPYGRPVDDARVERVAAESDLLLTGGSDAHKRTLAEAGLTAEAFEPVRDRLPDPPAKGTGSLPIDEQD
ncbi:histidinol-phosphatase [Halorubrum sp. Ea1]|uniref:PHP domain-containing protein n=1 Tax=Halorubrum sp. Ea1 TaxID=1480718 RepID=UPI000B993C29|nr:PHP domain-containing protein [Halorubrum sp. Ea1]OYR53147.1 histidinol-phosphatase [Halorubrum sp. Ea1]